MPNPAPEELKRFVQESADASLAVDAEFNIIAFNEKFQEMSGRPDDKISGLLLNDVIKFSASQLESIKEKGYLFNLRTELLKPGGANAPVTLQSVLLKDEAGKPAGSVISVSESQAAHLELLVSFLKSLRSVADTIGSSKNRREILDRICENFVRMSGYNSIWIALTDPVEGDVRLISEYGFGVLPIAEDLKRGEFCCCMKLSLAQSQLVIIEDPLSVCGGCPISTIFGKTSAMTKRIEYVGRVYGVINVHASEELILDRKEQDIFSEIALSIGAVLHGIELEEQRAAAEEETIKARKLKSDFISLISHSMRTPLTPVSEGVNILIEGIVGDLNAEQKQILKTVQRNTERLSKIIGRVVELEKMQNGMEPLNIRDEDAGRVLEEVKKSATRAVMLKNLELALSLPETPVHAEMDAPKIKEVIELLVSNAVRHTAEGSITISLAKEGEKAVFSVADTGLGIKEEDQAKIFERFETLGKVGETTAGAGLGLSICREIIKMHGGNISVKSGIGSGSTFTFEIPLKHSVNPYQTGGAA